MFGLSFRSQRKKKIKCTPDPDHYPLNTCLNLINFIKNYPHLTDAKLANRILSITNKKISVHDVYDLVQATRAALPVCENLVERIKNENS